MINNEDIIHIPIDGILDLHTFNPRDVKDLIPDYIEECRKYNINTVRIIHGKGTGTMKTIVHSLLKKNPLVKSFRLAMDDTSSWGATIAELNKPEE